MKPKVLCSEAWRWSSFLYVSSLTRVTSVKSVLNELEVGQEGCYTSVILWWSMPAPPSILIEYCQSTTQVELKKYPTCARQEPESKSSSTAAARSWFFGKCLKQPHPLLTEDDSPPMILTQKTHFWPKRLNIEKKTILTMVIHSQA